MSLRRLLMAGASAVVSYRSRLQFGGADASTTFTDDTGKTWTAFGNAQIDTALGDQRGLFDGASDYITTPNHADLVFGSGNFKVAFTLRFNSKTGFQTISNKGYVPTSGASGNGWLIQTGNGTGLLTWYLIPSGGGSTAIISDSGTINTGQDYLIEFERIGTTLSLKRDGVTIGTATDTNNYSFNGDMSIGGGSSSGYNNFWFNGWIKDFRVS